MTSCTRCRVAALAVAVVSGLLFGVGLAVSGMTDPARVIGFLDPLNAWDPSLAFVVGGAIVAYAIAYRVIMRRSDPWFDLRFHLPTRRDIDVQLVLGAALFGIGWGLGGLCPGPGIVAAASGNVSAILFAVAMVVGMLARDRLASRRERTQFQRGRAVRVASSFEVNPSARHTKAYAGELER